MGSEYEDQFSLTNHICIAFTLIAITLVFRQWMYEDIARTYCCLQSDNLDTLPLKEFWRFLLPYDGGGAGFTHWSTSGMAVGEIIRRIVGNLHNANFVFIALAMCSAYWCGWSLFKNIIPAVTLTLLIGLGTHLNYAYYHNHVGVFHLYVAYLLLNITFAYNLIFQNEFKNANKVGFFSSLMLVMLFSEIWINYFAFLLTSILFLWCISVKRSDFEIRHRIKTAVFSVMTLMALYLPIRLSYGTHISTPGGEEEIIFTYPYIMLMLDDFLINIFTYLHAAITSFITPFFSFSNSLVFIGSEEIMAQQNGYHPAGNHLVSHSHLFMWRFVAGGMAFGFFYLLISNTINSFSTKNLLPVFIVLLCFMILFGFASHSIIKYRPYNSAPFLTYKCITSVIGVYLLTTAYISFLNSTRSRLVSYGACFILILLILSNSATRPYYENSAYNETHLWYKKPYTDFSF